MKRETPNIPSGQAATHGAVRGVSRAELKYLPVAQLVALKRNPQYCTEKQMAALEQSIKREGFLAPILVRPMKKNGSFEIISGNHRVMAARRVGLAEVPCVVAKLTDREAKRLIVNLNTIHGEPSAETLASFLAELDDIDLPTIHLEKGLLDDLLVFDETLEKRLADLQAPDELNRNSSTQIPTCICAKCGRLHQPKAVEDPTATSSPSVPPPGSRRSRP